MDVIANRGIRNGPAQVPQENHRGISVNADAGCAWWNGAVPIASATRGQRYKIMGPNTAIAKQ